MKLHIHTDGTIHFWCPGCNCAHELMWNAPTFNLPVLATGEKRCHCFVREGKIKYLNICEHDLKGQTVELPEWPFKGGSSSMNININKLATGTLTGLAAWLVGLLMLACTGCHITPLPGPTPAPTNSPTPPAPQPVTNTPPIVATGTQILNAFYIPTVGKQAWMDTVLPMQDGTHFIDSPLGWLQYHPETWEGQARASWAQTCGSIGAKAFCYWGWYQSGNTEFDSFVLDATYNPPNHIADANNAAVWMAKQGCTIHMPIWKDGGSPDMSHMEAIIKFRAASYASARTNIVSQVIPLMCVEGDRFGSIADYQQLDAWTRKYFPDGVRTVIGSQNQAWLLQALAANPQWELWKEQDGDPVTSPITSATFAAYRNELLALANAVAAKLGISQTQARGRVWAGEWCDKNLAEWQSETAQLMADGFNVSGVFQ